MPLHPVMFMLKLVKYQQNEFVAVRLYPFTSAFNDLQFKLQLALLNMYTKNAKKLGYCHRLPSSESKPSICDDRDLRTSFSCISTSSAHFFPFLLLTLI